MSRFWSDGTRRTRPIPRERCIHELFEEQVERTPTAIAVEFEDRTLSYAELNAQANQLARYLRDQESAPIREWGCAWSAARRW